MKIFYTKSQALTANKVYKDLLKFGMYPEIYREYRRGLKFVQKKLDDNADSHDLSVDLLAHPQQYRGLIKALKYNDLLDE